MDEKYIQTIASLMKHGRKDEILEFFNQPKPPVGEDSFVSYMDSMIKRSGMSRAKIANNVGLSCDYMYKVLRGDKITKERDYIIAVCLSMQLSVLQTQHAIELYPFPVLDDKDPRSAIILCAINEKTDCYKLDEWLEKADLPLLKVSPDMPSVKVGPTRSTLLKPQVINSISDEGHETSKKRRFITMEKTNTIVIAEQCGNAPFDYFYAGEFELKNQDETKVYVQALFWPDGKSVYGVVKHSIEEDVDENDTKNSVLEEYDTLEGASKSAYFQYYLELDKLTDKKAAETMAKVNDTKYYGFRMCKRLTDDGPMMYSEAFNNDQPELNEYIQIRQTANGYIFSASHKSFYMQFELTDLDEVYEMYFGSDEEQFFLFEIESLDDLGKYEYFRPTFEQMLDLMNNNNSNIKGEKKMSGKKELSRRSMYTEENGMGCGPFSTVAIDAEIVVDDNGKTVYLHAQWVDAVGDEVYYEATKESMYDFYERLSKHEEDEEDILTQKDQAEKNTVQDWFPECDLSVRYAEVYLELMQMIQAELDAHDIDVNLFEKDEE